MNTIKQLIEKYCPDGVEYKKLGEIGFFYSGLSGKSKDDFKDGNAMFITYMNVYSNPSTKLDVIEKVKIGQGEKQNKIEKGDILFTGSSETPDECGMSSVVTDDITSDYYLNSFCFGFRLNNKDTFEPNFLKHLFRDRKMRAQIARTANGVTRYNVSKRLFARIIIPVPPLPVQREIVRILDNLTSLEAELEAELEARKKQYYYFLNKLVYSETWPEFKLLDILERPITDGPHETPEILNEGIPFISAEAIHDLKIDFNKKRGFISNNYNEVCNKKYCPQKGDVYIVKSGSTTGKIAMVETNIKFNIWSPIAAMRVNKNNCARFLFFLMQADYVQAQVKLNMSKGSQPNLSMRKLEQFSIKVPSLNRQMEIASVLDDMERLINGASDGLSGEISARHKQYEYYRDKLLTFKRKEA